MDKSLLKVTIEKFKSYLVKRFCIFHFSLLLLSLLNIIRTLIYSFVSPFVIDIYEYHYLTDFMVQKNLLMFILNSMIIFGYFLFFNKLKNKYNKFSKSNTFIILFFDIVLLFLSFCKSKNFVLVIALISLYALCTKLPKWITQKPNLVSEFYKKLIHIYKNFESYNFGKLYSVIIILVLFQLIVLIIPFLTQKLKVNNEFYNIPTTVILNNKTYDYQSFIQDNRLFKFENGSKYKKYERNSKEKKELIEKFDRYYSKTVADQIIDRHWFSHQAYFIMPLNELDLGKDKNDIYMQYGYGATFITQHILNVFNRITYQDTHKFLIFTQLLYYLCFLGILFLLFEKVEIVAPIWLLLIYGYNKLGYFSIYVGPGVSPMRHFLDIFVLLFLFLYFKNNNKLYLWINLPLILISIFIHKTYGLFITIPYITCLFIKIIEDYKNKIINYHEIAISILSLVVMILSSTYFNFGNDPLSKFYVSGSMGLFHLNYYKVFLIFMLTLCIYMVFDKYKKNTPQYVYSGLFSIFYLQLYYVYFILSAESSHFYLMFPIVILPFVFLILTILKNNKIFIDNKNKFCLLVTLIIFFAYYVPSINSYYYTDRIQTRPLRHSVMYEWNFKKANLLSPINPKYIEDSIWLINKYIDKKTKGIYILSVYDKILPFLAEKYSKMPYFDVEWFLFNDDMQTNVINLIKTEKPKYLFVDKTFYTPIIDSASFYSGLSQESKYKFERNERLKEIFNSVKNDYEPVESSYLLTVYKRKAN